MFAVIKDLFQIVGYKIGTFEQAIDIIGGLAFHAIRCVHEGCVFGRGPIEFWDDVPTEFGDGGFYLLVEFWPLG